MEKGDNNPFKGICCQAFSEIIVNARLSLELPLAKQSINDDCPQNCISKLEHQNSSL